MAKAALAACWRSSPTAGRLADSPAHAEFAVKEVGRVQERDAMVKKRIANGERILEMANFGENVEMQDGPWRLDSPERA